MPGCDVYSAIAASETFNPWSTTAHRYLSCCRFTAAYNAFNSIVVHYIGGLSRSRTRRYAASIDDPFDESAATVAPLGGESAARRWRHRLSDGLIVCARLSAGRCGCGATDSSDSRLGRAAPPDVDVSRHGRR